MRKSKFTESQICVSLLIALACGRPFPRCSHPPEVPHLTSYIGVEPGQRAWLDMSYAASEWLPAEAIALLPHHRSRLELANLTEFFVQSPATAQPPQRLRFFLEMTHTELSKLPDREQWRSVYHARIVEVCEP